MKIKQRLKGYTMLMDCDENEEVKVYLVINDQLKECTVSNDIKLNKYSFI